LIAGPPAFNGKCSEVTVPSLVAPGHCCKVLGAGERRALVVVAAVARRDEIVEAVVA
jgi:hypothetical protein